jgi:WD40 repeat protein
VILFAPPVRSGRLRRRGALRSRVHDRRLLPLPPPRRLGGGSFEPTIHLPGHESGTTALACAPDGAILGSAGLDGTVRLWHVASRRLLHTLHHPDRSVLTIAWAPDGKQLVSSGGNGLICLWDPATGKEVRRLQGHQGAVAALAFSPDGATLASGGDDRTIRLWDPARGSERRSWRARTGEQEWLTGLAFAPDGKQLASAGIRGQALRGILNSIGTSDAISLWDPGAIPAYGTEAYEALAFHTTNRKEQTRIVSSHA